MVEVRHLNDEVHYLNDEVWHLKSDVRHLNDAADTWVWGVWRMEGSTREVSFSRRRRLPCRYQSRNLKSEGTGTRVGSWHSCQPYMCH